MEAVTGIVFGVAVVFGWLLSRPRVSRTADASSAERKNGIGRRQNSREAQKIHGFSKDWDVQDAAPYFLGFSYNFSRPVRALRERGLDGRSQPRALAMAAGPAERVWAMEEWATYPTRPPSRIPDATNRSGSRGLSCM